MKQTLRDKLQKDVVLGAEGYLFELERRGFLKAGAFVPEVVLDYPQAVEELHKEFLRAGAEVMVAFTYYAHRAKLKVIGRENDLEPMNKKALSLAKKVATEENVLLAGNICNTWAYDPDDKKSEEVVRNMYIEQVKWAKEAGADFIIAETIEYIGEALIALNVIKSFGLQSLVTFGPTYEKSKDGFDWIDGCKKLQDNGADVVGFNCIRGPKTMFPLLKKLRKEVSGFIAAQPVPYHTTSSYPAFQFLKDNEGKIAFPTNLDPFLLTRTEMADFAKEAKELGVNYIGICCGAGPHHVRSMAEALGRTVEASKYSPDMSQHGLLGNGKVVQEHEKKYLKLWK